MENTEDRTKSEEVKAVESERLELLRAVAAVCPEDWETFLSSESLCLAVPTGEWDRTLPDPNPFVDTGVLRLDSDAGCGDAILFLFDVMEEAGWCWHEWAKTAWGRRLKLINDTDEESIVLVEGDTRAQAVAKAFIQVMNTEVLSTTAHSQDSEPAVTENESQDIPVSRQPKRKVKIEE